MTIKQISLFLENKPGHLASICKALADAKINIVTLSLADTQQFGIVRLIVDDWEKADAVLKAAGFAVNVRDVLAVGVRDEPGGMTALLAIIEKAGVNIEYMYAFAAHVGSEAVLVFRFDDGAKAEKALADAGVQILPPSEALKLR
jgi:hypothetical protein